MGARPSICLNMIVKDERAVLHRCLDSVKPFIDYWVIVDTGSTDGTQDLIRSLLCEVPGELYERAWKNFGHNRTEALQLAEGKGEYLLIVDADEVLEAEPGFRMPPLTADAYELRTLFSGDSYYRTQLVKNGIGWRYEGVLHEYITSDRAGKKQRLEGLVNRPSADGARSRNPKKFEKDAAVLEAALEDEPENTRYVFYLAQSYRDAGDLSRAIEVYERRARMGGFDEEVWYSRYQIAGLRHRLGEPWPIVLESYLRAYQERPQRAEPLCDLAAYYRADQRYAVGHLFADAARKTLRPDDVLFVNESVYAWRAEDEFAVAAFYVGRVAEALEANSRLLRNPDVPLGELDRIERNRAFCLERLRAEPSSGAPVRKRSGAKSKKRRR